MPKVDPFIHLACDINGVSYDEGEEYHIVDKLAIMSFLKDDPDLRQRYPYIHSPRPIISQADFTKLDNYYHLTEHLNGNHPFTRMTTAHYLSSDKEHIPKHIQKILEILFDDYCFCFHLDFDYSNPKKIANRILTYNYELAQNLRYSDLRSDIKCLVALHDFVPRLSVYDKSNHLHTLLEEIETSYANLVAQVNILSDITENILSKIPTTN